MSGEPKDTSETNAGSDERRSDDGASVERGEADNASPLQDELIEAEFVAVEDAPGEPAPAPAPKRSWAVVAALAIAGFALAISILSFIPRTSTPSAETDRAISDLSDEMERLAARQPTDGASDADVSALEAQLADARAALAEMTARLDALAAAAPTEAQGNTESVPDLAQRLAALEAAPAANNAELAAMGARLDALSEAVVAQRAAADELGAAVTDIAARLTGVRANSASGSGAGAAAALAFAALEEASADGRAFAIEYAAAEPHFAGQPAFEQLAAYAETGTPTLADLNGQFREVARAVRGAEAGGGGFIDQVSRAVTGVVTAQRTDAPVTEAAGDILVRAQARLDRGDLAAAIGEMGRLDGSAAEQADEWMQAAAARLDVDNAIDALRSQLIGG